MASDGMGKGWRFRDVRAGPEPAKLALEFCILVVEERPFRVALKNKLNRAL